MAAIAELRKQAKDLGIAKSAILGAKSSTALQNIIDSHNGASATVRPVKKSSVKPVKKVRASTTTQDAPKRKPGRPRKVQTDDTQAQEAPKRRGRPPGSKNKPKPATATKPVRAVKSASSKSVPAKSTSGRTQAKRPTTASDDLKRNMLNGVNYSQTEGWNPRPGTPPDRIIKALKKHKGNRTKVYEELAPSVNEFVKTHKNNKQRRTKDEKLAMLRYRISRTAWEFAVRTKQHDTAEGRVAYGTGGTGYGIYERKSARKSTAKPKPARRGRPPKAKPATRKPAARKPAPKPATRRKPAAKPKPATRKPRAKR